MKNFIFLLISAALLAVFYSYDKSNGFVGLNFDSGVPAQGVGNPKEMLWIFICMLVGIIFGQAYRTNEAGKSVNMTNLCNTELWRSLFVSPIVFGAVYLVAKDHPDVVVASILSFENGFICNVVAEKRLKTLKEK